ncbi:uncharacterized protein [Bemisia tabaci]|uniref:uncharacterized protein n=1 Tax=Bemisia tabaci TaxID=7038 RepID=UPI003B28779E
MTTVSHILNYEYQRIQYHQEGLVKGGLKVFAKVLEDCNSEDYSKIASCLGVKTIVALDRAARAGSIDLISGVKLVKTEDAESLRNGRSLTEEDIQNSIDAEPTERSSRLLDLLFESATKFLQSHSLEFKFPQTSPQELQRAFEEGRGKIKKKLYPILALLGLKIFAVLPLIIGVVGLLAAKAFFIGKIALIVAGILAIQKYSHGGYSGIGSWGKIADNWTSATNQAATGWNSAAQSAPGGGYYKRSMNGLQGAHEMAYSAQIPASSGSADS